MGLNIGGLFFTLDADTRGLLAAQRRLSDFSRQVTASFRAASPDASAFRAQEALALRTLNRVKAIQDQIRSSAIRPADQARLLSQLSTTFNNFTRRIATTDPLSSLDLGRRAQQINGQLASIQRQFRQTQQEALRAGSGIGTFSGILHGLGAASLFVQGHLGGMSTRFFALTQLIKEFGLAAALATGLIAGLSAGMSTLVMHAINTGRAFEGTVKALTAVSGNAAVAATHIDFVKSVANQAGIEFNSTAKAYTRFLASGEASGQSLKDIQDSFRGTAVAAATLQVSAEDVQGVFRALDQIMSKGRVQAEELRGQLGDRLPGAFAIAARAMGVTTVKLNEMMKKGEVVSREFVPKFVQEMLKVYNIDISKPVDTLNASLGRLQTQWQFFGIAVNQATNATGIAAGIIDALASGLETLALNLETVAGIVGALIGAFAGLAVAMAVNAVITYVAAWGSLTTAIAYAIIVVRQLVMSIWTMNAALMTNPIIAVTTAFVALVAVIGGAKLGYDALSGAIAMNNAALGQLDQINGYINAQMKLGHQVSVTTNAMREQIMVQGRLAAATAAQAAMEVGRLHTEGPGFIEELLGGGSKKVIAEAEARADAAIAISKRWSDAYDDVTKLAKLPEKTVAPMAAASGPKPKKPKAAPENAINQVEDFILKMKEAQAIMNDLSQGPSDIALIEDLYEARRALNNLNKVQLGKVDAALAAAGFTAGRLDERLGAVFTATRQATEAADAFKKVWRDIQEEGRALVAVQEELAFLQQGGDPRRLFQFKGLHDAREALRRLNPETESGRRALETIRQSLVEMGYAGDTATAALANFFNQRDQAEQFRDTLADIAGEIEKTQDALTRSTRLNDFWKMGANAGEAAERAYDRGEKALEYVRRLQAIGVAQADINAFTSNYLDILRDLDQQNYVFERTQVAAQRARDSLRAMANDGVEGFKDVLKGVKSVNDALRDLAASILDNMWTQYVTGPMNDFLDNRGRKKGERAVSGLDSAVAGIGSLFGSAANDNQASGVNEALTNLMNASNAAAGSMNDNLLASIMQSVGATTQEVLASNMSATAAGAKATQDAVAATAAAGASAALAAMTAAATAAAAALTAVAAAGGTGEGGEGGGGTLGMLFNLGLKAASAYAGAQGGGGGASAGGFWDSMGAATAAGRAIGGTMAPGQLYQINEPGISGEYFIPSVAGYMSQHSMAANNNGPSIHVDARTTIDARGATRDAIAELRAEQRKRDSRLRQEIPYMVDSRLADSRARLRGAG